MNQPFVRRVVLTLSLGTLALVAPGALLAQNAITGTDPCPKGINCAASARITSPTKAPSTSTASTSTGSTVMQALLVLLGAA